jgi:hypothetical protein
MLRRIFRPAGIAVGSRHAQIIFAKRDKEEEEG